MGFFNFGKKKDNNANSKVTPDPAVQAPTPAPVSNVSASGADTPLPPTATITLKKAAAGLDRTISLKKQKEGIDLSSHRARVAIVMDHSGSMTDLFRNGSVQETLTRLLPLALRFDDNGELEVYVFNEDCEQVPTNMDIQNYQTYVKDEIYGRGLRPCCGTNYAPAVNMTVEDYNDGSPYPAFVIFITDGENWDAHDTDRAIRRSANYPIFYQFIGIGDESFSYLKKLDDLDGRPVDNTAFVKVEDFERLDDDQLYQKLLEQYPAWLKAMHII